MASETTTELADKLIDMLESHKLSGADDMRIWTEQYLISAGVSHANAERIAKAIEDLNKEESLIWKLLQAIIAILTWMKTQPGSSMANPFYIHIVNSPVNAQLVDALGAPIGQDMTNPLHSEAMSVDVVGAPIGQTRLAPWYATDLPIDAKNGESETANPETEPDTNTES